MSKQSHPGDLEKRSVNKAIASKGVRFAHLKIGEKSAATVAYCVLGDVLYYGVTYKYPDDLFCRAEGRLRSMRRLFNRERFSGEIHMGGHSDRDAKSQWLLHAVASHKNECKKMKKEHGSIKFMSRSRNQRQQQQEQ